VANAAAPAAAPAPGPFKSDNASYSGYLQDAMNAFAPKLRGIADEAGRKSALADYLNQIAPEVQARGGSLGNIHGDKATVNGRTIDFFGDIEGAATPQYLDVTDEKPAAQGGMTPMPTSVNPILQGDAGANIQNALSGIGAASQSNILQQLIQQLQGGR
jgi:hypothetical protein